MKHIFLAATALLFFLGCNGQRGTSRTQDPNVIAAVQSGKIVTGAEQVSRWELLLKGKKVALLVNQTAMVGNTHLVDTMVALKIDVVKIFAPEHGFRGGADAGEDVKDSVDAKTKIPVVSIYGSKVKPTDTDLAGIDLVVFDIQDVGARFYTFISSLHYMMEACADNDVALLVLDRPNPNGFYVDGPVLKKEFSSFVGVDPIPVVHGLTVAEYAQMVNGEEWLGKDKKCRLQYVNCVNYTHARGYVLPVKPSPNLPNAVAVYLYPWLCFFEGTNVSLGRGTDRPFQIIGAPELTGKQYTTKFTPKSMPGAKNPPLLNKECKGLDLSNYMIDTNNKQIQLHYLLDAYNAFPDKSKFFLANNFIDKLAGTDELRKQILADKTEVEIRASWQPALNDYKVIRSKYLLYKDFE
jgi:uncharacterized protein YbbC (DUF1343 family)